ncbi:hypothetical protein J4760_04185 [Salinicoccus sp. ID82-1]|uniref:hypothetical protein n=1 Tax=Salinicoccus sp. ID82-1 TaxID=2820269 RepID=UPI001F15D9A4|nr:hypothetical protein [Salinicoccus sp. ID82-1]MCG1009251.1 hypothetical protein [Salinicoccus sp. ID82-1]
MKIKTAKQMRLDELIKYVWEKEDYPNRFVNNFNGEVVFNCSGKFMTDDSFISHNSLFTVEVEEEVTEDTVLEELLDVIQQKEGKGGKIYDSYTRKSIRGVLDLPAGDHVDKDLTIYHVNEKGILTLLWSAEYGIPTEGVLEVDSNA